MKVVTWQLISPNTQWPTFAGLTMPGDCVNAYSPWAGRVHRAPQLINFMVIFGYLYTSHCRINLSPKNTLGFFFSLSLYLYPIGSKSQDFCDSVVWLSLPGIACVNKLNIFRYYHVAKCLSFLMIPQQLQWHLEFRGKMKIMYPYTAEKSLKLAYLVFSV